MILTLRAREQGVIIGVFSSKSLLLYPTWHTLKVLLSNNQKKNTISNLDRTFFIAHKSINIFKPMGFMKHLWHEISTGPSIPEIVHVVVENPMGSRNKYEYNKDYNLMEFNRIIFSPFHYPGDYGFIPRTYCEDGDALDALVLVTESGYPMTLMRARPVAVLNMLDEEKCDNKIICVPLNDPRFENVHDKKDLSIHLLKEIGHFFQVYKELEGKKIRIEGWGSAYNAKMVIGDAINLYKQMFNDANMGIII